MAGNVERISDQEMEAALLRIELVSRMMDGLFEIPGTNVRIGFDAMIGVIPVLGDLISQAVSSYLIWEARRLGVSRLTLARMAANSAIDTVVGLVPFIGDAFDIGFRANLRNLALLKAHLEKTGRVMPGRYGPGAVIDATATRVD